MRAACSVAPLGGFEHGPHCGGASGGTPWRHGGRIKQRNMEIGSMEDDEDKDEDKNKY